MNQLTVTEKNTLSLLPVDLREYVVLKQEPPVNKLRPVEVELGCLDIVTIIHTEVGSQKATEKSVLEFQKTALVNELRGKLGVLTLSEVKKALQMGIRNEFGEYYGLCATSYNKFLKGFMAHPDRIRANTEYLKLLDSETFKRAERPVTERLKETNESCLQAFQEYKSEGKLPLTSWAYYDHIKQTKGIDWTQEQREEIKAAAQREYTTKLKEDKMNRIITTAQYETIISNLDGAKNRPLINICKKISLKKYFDQLIKEGRELEL